MTRNHQVPHTRACHSHYPPEWRTYQRRFEKSSALTEPWAFWQWKLCFQRAEPSLPKVRLGQVLVPKRNLCVRFVRRTELPNLWYTQPLVILLPAADAHLYARKRPVVMINSLRAIVLRQVGRCRIAGRNLEFNCLNECEDKVKKRFIFFSKGADKFRWTEQLFGHEHHFLVSHCQPKSGSE